MHTHILHIEADDKCSFLGLYILMSPLIIYFLSSMKYRKLPDVNLCFRASDRLLTLYIIIMFLIQLIITQDLSSYHNKSQNSL
jgi:hypothetical protein